MGWFSKLLYKDTDLISDMYDLESCLKSIGFDVTKMDDTSQNDVLLNRVKARRGKLELTAVWDGELITFLQKWELSGPPDPVKYMEFHQTKNYFTLTYGGTGHTIIVKHSAVMFRETPLIASSIQRVLLTWEEGVNITALFCQ